MMRLFRFLGVVCTVLLCSSAIAETSLPPLKSAAILTVTGLDPQEFPDGTIGFDLGRLEALGVSEVTTTTMWTEGPHTFSGVRMQTLLAYLGITEGALTAIALNDYSVEIPVSDAVPDGPIIAYAMDGQPMPVRDRGPLWIVYPFDQNPDYQSEVIYTRAIWQLNHIEVQR